MRERAPDLPIVAVSGMTALDAVSRTSELSDVVCLQKPFRPERTDPRHRSGARIGRQAAAAVAARESAGWPAKENAPANLGAFDAGRLDRAFANTLGSYEPLGLISV